MQSMISRIEESPAHELIKDCALVIGASLLISLSGSLSLPLFFTPIPLVFQAQMILISALLLGSKRATLATLLFLAQGAIGLPVFSLGGCGIGHFLGLKGGYLLGYFLAAFITGVIYENSRVKDSVSALIAMLFGNSVILLMGFSWLSTFIGSKAAFMLGVLPFIAIDCIKLMIVAKSLPWIRKISSKVGV